MAMPTVSDFHPARARLASFVEESLMIEGIFRLPTIDELVATEEFLTDECSVGAVLALQAVYAPGMPLRDRFGLNVRVGRYVAPAGNPNMRVLLDGALKPDDPFQAHVEFEKLHPFMDGNGRTGRAVWVWKMLRNGQDPFALTFLHRFYYQTLEHAV